MNKNKFPVRLTLFSLFFILGFYNDVNTLLASLPFEPKPGYISAGKSSLTNLVTAQTSLNNTLNSAIQGANKADEQLAKIKHEIDRENPTFENRKFLIKDTVNVLRELKRIDRGLTGALFDHREHVIHEFEKYNIKTQDLLTEDGSLKKPISIEFQSVGILERIGALFSWSESSFSIETQNEPNEVHIKIKGNQKELQHVVKRINALPNHNHFSTLEAKMQQNSKYLSDILEGWQKLVSQHINVGQLQNSQNFSSNDPAKILQEALMSNKDNLKNVLQTTSISFEDKEIEMLSKIAKQIHPVESPESIGYKRTKVNHAISISRIFNNISQQIPNPDNGVPDITLRYT